MIFKPANREKCALFPVTREPPQVKAVAAMRMSASGRISPRTANSGFSCSHLHYLGNLVDKLGLDYSFDTHLSAKAEERRAQGVYEQ